MPMRLPLGHAWLVPALVVATTLVSRPAAAVSSAELYRPTSYFHGRVQPRHLECAVVLARLRRSRR